MPTDPPLYRRVVDQLRADMQAGVQPVGSALPGEKQLEERFGVSRITIRRAIAELVGQGLVERSPGRTARVVAPRFVQSIASFEDPFGPLRLVRNTSVRLLSFEWQVAAGAVARALTLENGDRLLRVERLRCQDGKPVSHIETFLPAALGVLVDRGSLNTSTLYEVLAAAGHVPERADRQMTAAPCPKSLAGLLGLKSGEPTFRVERVSRDAQGQSLHLMIGHWRWDRFTMRLASNALTFEAGEPSALQDGHVSPGMPVGADYEPSDRGE